MASSGPAPVDGAGHALACAVACPTLAARVARRFGSRLSLRAPGDPAAGVSLCEVESFVSGPQPDRAWGERGAARDLLVVMAREPGEALEAALLTGGADEVIDETRSAALILARLHALARRHRRSHAARVLLGPWIIDFETEEAREAGDEACGSRGRRVPLTRMEMRLLRYLASREGAPVASPELLARVFGYNDRVETHTLETHVYRLRRKLEVEPRQPRLLVRRTDGYSLALGTDVGEAGTGSVVKDEPFAPNPVARPASEASARHPCALR